MKSNQADGKANNPDCQSVGLLCGVPREHAQGGQGEHKDADRQERLFYT